MTTPITRHTIAALVENRPGVLVRVANLFRRRAFNIDSLTVGRTHRDDFSRMTMVMEGTREEAERVEKNLYKMVNVVQVEHMNDVPCVERDLTLIKIRITPDERRDITQLCDIFRARIIDVSQESMIVELTGTEEKIENFTELLRPYDIIEMVRTGVVAMGRGEHNLKDHGYQPQGQIASRRKSVL
jgi:acetolactate synthase-1/3 small subunit